MRYSLISKIIVLDFDDSENNFTKEYHFKKIIQKSKCKLDISDLNLIFTPLIGLTIFSKKINEKIIKIWTKLAELFNSEHNINQRWLVRIVKMLYSSINFLIWDKVYKILLLVKNPFEIIATYIIYKKLPNIFKFLKKPWKNRFFGYKKKLKRHTKIHLYILYQVIKWNLWS